MRASRLGSAGPSMRGLLAVALVAGWVGSARAAQAQVGLAGADLRGWSSPTDPRAGLALEPASSPGRGAWNLGLASTWASRPVVLPVDGGRVLVSQQLGQELLGGVGLGRHWFLGASLPWVAWQGGPARAQEDARRLGGPGLPQASLGELALSAKLTLVAPEGELGGFGVALRQRMTFPTASSGSFHAEGALTEETRLLVDYGLVGLRLHGALGLLVRHEVESGPCSLEVGAPFATGCTLGLGNEVPFLVGLSVRPQAFGWDRHGRTTIFLESRGFVALGPQGAFDGSGTSGLLLGGGGRWEFARDVSVLLGAEVAVVPALGAAPLRGLASLTWAPRTPDADHDQVPDDVDQCQELAEDRDGVQDSDGCPELEEGEEDDE